MFRLLLVVWAILLMAFAVTVVPDAYWYSYYSVDYTMGFVRRGLAGELVGLFPDNHYFAALRVLRWFPTAFLAIGLAVLARVVAVGSGRSERRRLLALLTPVLPFGFAFGLFSARPDLFGATALIGFALAVQAAGSARSVVMTSAVFGGILAVLTLMHEAIPLLFGFGALVALSVLAHDRSERTLRLSAMLAIAPGLLTTLAIALLGRRGISPQLCALVPRGPIHHPLAGNPTLGAVLSGSRFEVDYHDWVCRNITPLYDQTIGDAVNFVASLGVIPLAASTALGIALLALTILSLSHVSGVPFSRMRSMLRRRSGWVLSGLALFVPIFLTGADWTRWWVMITFDVGVVFALFASGEKESAEPLTLSTRTILFVVALVLAAPLGGIPGLGLPVPM
jgi:hypothetical protein